MSWVKNKFFGGAEKRAAKKQVESTQEAQRILQTNIDRARGEVRPLFEQAQTDITGGFQRARDIFAETVPQQAQLFQAGNEQARNTLLAGLPQIQNAILGNAPVDLSALQPQQPQQGNGLQGGSLPLPSGLTPPPITSIADNGSEILGPLQQAPQAQTDVTIADQIAAGNLTFATMTDAQRRQFALERNARQEERQEQNNFGPQRRRERR